MAEGYINTNPAEWVNVANGIDCYRVGHLCAIFLTGGSDTATIPEGYRPRQNVQALMRGTDGNNVRQVCLVTIVTNGEMTTSYFVPNSTTANTFTGILNGQIVYTI